LRTRLPPPVAWLAMDDLLATLTIPPQDFWRTGLAAGYELLVADSEALLPAGFTVLVESTFTLVPLDDAAPPEFHLEQLQRLREVARAAGARFDLVALTASRTQLLRRRELTGRLWDSVVEGSARLHEEARPHLGDAVLDTSDMDIEAVCAWTEDVLQAVAPTR
jgi:hypothetical protein